MFEITKYADRLLSDLDTVNYLPKIKKQQEEWIGRSEGAEVDFELHFVKDPSANENRGPNGEKARITTFTTRIDTLFGATYLVLAPEHLWVTLATDDQHDLLENKEEVKAYVESVKVRPEIERTAEGKEKTGVELKGVKAINPATGEQIPVFIADYVLPQYGTGAIFGDAHDVRDVAFAKKYNVPLKEVLIPTVYDHRNPPQEGKENTFRKTVLVIVRDPETNKYLCLKWKKQPWTTFITGGVEEGEDAIEASRREVEEETGYSDLRLIRPLGGMIESQFFAAHKNVNRRVHSQTVFFELVSRTQKERTQEEQEQYDLLWLTEEEVVAAKLQHGDFETFWPRVITGDDVFTGEGVLIDSGEYTGMKSEDARSVMTERYGRLVVKYKLRDWVFSRQRYWGEPIPLIHCEKDGWVAVPDAELPVRLPEVEKYEPTDNGESPLSTIDSFVNTKCPECGGAAKRETDTMPNWAGSSWYFLRYIDPKNDQAFASKEALKYWTPVDLYNGGMEHTVLHLLYSRFWNKFLFDRGHVPTSEPYARRHSHGLIMSEDGTKMSKSKGNVVNPDDIVNEFGADTFRVNILFIGPFEEAAPWTTNGVIGVRRFLDKTVRLVEKIAEVEDPAVTKMLHKTIVKITEDIENFRFNTAVAQLMIFVNTVQERGAITKESLGTFLKVLAPFAPHVANELWEKIGGEGFAEIQPWPVADTSILVEDEMQIAVQVNGKIRATITMPVGATDEEIVAKARAEENVAKYVTIEPKKVIVVKGKLVSFVV
ncbi:MAG: class I tRNA ligase family protein [Patescibacteria group bacterium]